MVEAGPLELNMDIEHRTVIVVGGGPAGLPLAAVLGGWHPYYKESAVFSGRYGPLAQSLKEFDGSLLGLNFRDLVDKGVAPVELFRTLHHPRQLFEERDQIALEFKQEQGLDVLLLTREDVGGLWNNAPRNLLTLSPGQWMEFAFYPLAQHIDEVGLDIDVNALIKKTDLIDYYHRIPARFAVEDKVRTFQEVYEIVPHEKGFKVSSRHVDSGEESIFTCKYLVYATGQRAKLRQLEVAGEDLPFVTPFYDKPEDFPGERVLVVGGGRSGDWAATELHDAGKQVYYSMRQGSDIHWRLINDSLYLPYYKRIAEILQSNSPRLEALYRTQITQIGADGKTVIKTQDGERVLEVDHIVKEIGGWADYSLLQGFPELSLYNKKDDYRFQVHQLQTHAHNYESIDIPNLYAGGYLAQGIGLVVMSMHGTTYAIAGDIMQKEGLL
ncbi:MAG: thioredoxin reductase (NADPH) [Candidatus Latescibacterota bacterium]